MLYKEACGNRYDQPNEEYERRLLLKDREILEELMENESFRYFLCRLGSWNYYHMHTKSAAEEGRRMAVLDLRDRIKVTGRRQNELLIQAEQEHLAVSEEIILKIESER